MRLRREQWQYGDGRDAFVGRWGLTARGSATGMPRLWLSDFSHSYLSIELHVISADSVSPNNTIKPW